MLVPLLALAGIVGVVIMASPKNQTPDTISASGPAPSPSSSATSKVSTSVLGALATATGTLATYLKALALSAAALLPAIKELYSIDRERAIARAAAAYFAVPAEWVWGILYGESRWVPVGLSNVSGLGPGVAGRKPDGSLILSAAYGEGQVLKSRWEIEAKWLRSIGLTPWAHSDLLDPRKAIWGVAASLGRAVHNRGGGIGRTPEQQAAAVASFASERGGQAVGGWWAGSSVAGATKKTGHVRKYGPEVFSTAKGSGWTRRGEVLASDHADPWSGRAVAFKLLSDPLRGAA